MCQGMWCSALAFIFFRIAVISQNAGYTALPVLIILGFTPTQFKRLHQHKSMLLEEIGILYSKMTNVYSTEYRSM
jgi:hypothetical protein